MYKMDKLKNIFKITYGVNLELCRLTIQDDGIKYVSRTSKNNGVSARVQRIEGVEPNPANTISVALTGSVLEAFLQEEEYYSGRDIAYLTPLQPMSRNLMLWYCICIRENQYKYNYGRGANTTIKNLLIPSRDETPNFFTNNELPDISSIPDYFLDEGYEKACWYMDNINEKAFESKYSSALQPYENINLNIDKWKKVNIEIMFKLEKGKFYSQDEYEEGEMPLITATDMNNGIMKMTNLEKTFDGNCITIGKVGMSAFYQKKEFCCSHDVTVLIPKYEKFNQYIAIFIITILGLEKFRWDYGRQIQLKACKTIDIKIPVIYDEGGIIMLDKNNNYIPDYDFMEKYIKSIKYSKGI